MRLSGAGTRVHAFGVCDDEEYFYHFIDGLLADIGASRDAVGGHPVGSCGRTIRSRCLTSSMGCCPALAPLMLPLVATPIMKQKLCL